MHEIIYIYIYIPRTRIFHMPPFLFSSLPNEMSEPGAGTIFERLLIPFKSDLLIWNEAGSDQDTEGPAPERDITFNPLLPASSRKTLYFFIGRQSGTRVKTKVEYLVPVDWT